MAGDWMKVEKVTPRKPEILEMAAMLELSADDVFGKLFRLWAWADDHTQDGNARGVTFALADSEIGVTGFADAMREVGWLEHIEPCLEFPRGGVRFVNFTRHNGQTAKARALTASRVAKHKSKPKESGNAPSVTSSVTEALAREEKRREECIPPTLTPAREEDKLPMLRTVATPPGCSPALAEAIARWQAWRLAKDGRETDGIRLETMLTQARSAGWDDTKIVKSITFSISKDGNSWLDPEVDFQRPRSGTNGARKPESPGLGPMKPIRESRNRTPAT